MALDRDRGLLVHAAAVETGMPGDLHLDRFRETDGKGMLAMGIEQPERTFVGTAVRQLKLPVAVAQVRGRQIDLDHAARFQL